MSWWMTAGKVVIAAESFYGFGSKIVEVYGSGSGTALGEVRRLWRMHLIEVICRNDLSYRDWMLALEPTINALRETLGRIPDWMPALTRETWKELRVEGGCPSSIDWGEILVSVATVGVALFVAWTIAKSADE